jgi:hypothetical protein
MKLIRAGIASFSCVVFAWALTARAADESGADCVPADGNWSSFTYDSAGALVNGAGTALKAICPLGGSGGDSTPTLNATIGASGPAISLSYTCTARITQQTNGGSIVASGSGAWSSGSNILISVSGANPNLFHIAGNVRCNLPAGGYGITGVSYTWS